MHWNSLALHGALILACMAIFHQNRVVWVKSLKNYDFLYEANIVRNRAPNCSDQAHVIMIHETIKNNILCQLAVTEFVRFVG